MRVSVEIMYVNKNINLVLGYFGLHQKGREVHLFTNYRDQTKG